MTNLPVSPEDITPEWLTGALTPRFPGVHVDTIELREVRHVTNCHSHLRIGYKRDAGAPEFVFCKLPPVAEPRRSVILKSEMGYTEALFYEQLAPHLPQFRLPDVYVAQRNDSDLSFIMIMEDLVHGGCEVPDGTWGIAPDSAARALEELAALHVRYEDPARRAAEVPWAPLARTRPAPGLGLLRFGLDNHRDKMTAAVARTAEVYLDHHAALIDLWASGPGPATVVHGDCHTGNLFVDKGRTGFLDWGVINITTPLRDAGYFLTMALQPDDRRAHEVDLLKHYLTARRALGGADISFDDAWRAHRLHALYTVPAACQILTFPEDAPPKRKVFASGFLNRVEAALDDLEALDALKQVTGIS